MLGGEFEGWANADMMRMLAHLKRQHNMRFLGDGEAVSETLRGTHERSFCDTFQVSSEQYACITHLFDAVGKDDIPTGASVADTPSVPTQASLRRRRCFTPDINVCCGRWLRVRHKSGTVYERDRVYPVWVTYKSCRSCKRRYLFDKTLFEGSLEGAPCVFHVYRSWSDNKIPLYVGSKSGRTIIATNYLRDAGVSLATMRYVWTPRQEITGEKGVFPQRL